nr:helix-turn-helix transcriptional regulator [Adlercreutzia caecimuris]
MARDASLDIERRCQLCAEKHSLTPREQEILEYLALGYTAIGIKDKLTISQNTAKSHIKNIYRKMGVHSQQQLIDAVFD